MNNNHTLLIIRKTAKLSGSLYETALRHKIWAALLGLGLIAGGWWVWQYFTSSSSTVSYTYGTVTRGDITSTITGSGQVSSSQELSLTPEVSGRITYVGVVPGQSVRAGQLIASIDATEAQKTVRDAEANLRSAELSYDKVREPATELELTQSRNSLSQAKNSLTTEYQNSVSDIASTYVDLPTIISGLQDINLGTTASGGSQWNVDYYAAIAANYSPLSKLYRDDAYNDYIAARKAYETAMLHFKSAPSSPDQVATDALLKETHDTALQIATAIKSSTALVQFYTDQLTQAGASPKSIATTHISTLNTYASQTQSHITALLGDINTLSSTKQDIEEKTLSLKELEAGADTYDLQSAEISLLKAKNSLKDAKDALAKYYITAPFAGIIGSVDAHMYDQASGVIATLITTKQYAELSVNEVDAATISIGNPVALTFDAIEDLTIDGVVAEVSPVGTVSQGVVSYSIKIALNKQDSRIKSGMTVSATIATASRQGALLVSSSAIKIQGDETYVQTVSEDGSIVMTPVTIGISDDTRTEITSGLTEGQRIVVKTGTGSSSSSTNTSTSNNSRSGPPGMMF